MVKLDYTLPPGTAAGAWAKAFPEGLNADTIDVVRLGVKAPGPGQPHQVAAAVELKGTAGVTDLRYLANLVAMGHLDASVDRVVDFDDLGEVRGLVADLLGRRVKGKAVLRMSQPG